MIRHWLDYATMLYYDGLLVSKDELLIIYT